MSLRSTISTPDGKRRYVRRLFATIADRYDFITVALSYGRDRGWKRQLIDLARITSKRTSPRASRRRTTRASREEVAISFVCPGIIY